MSPGSSRGKIDIDKGGLSQSPPFFVASRFRPICNEDENPIAPAANSLCDVGFADLYGQIGATRRRTVLAKH